MECKIKECKNNVLARSWCNKHYKRWYKYGDPFIIKREMHGYVKHPLYGIWRHMKARCSNENNKYYKDYGGRGIIVCNEWKNSSKNFIEWALSNGWDNKLIE